MVSLEVQPRGGRRTLSLPRHPGRAGILEERQGMRPVPHWHPGRRAGGSYRGPIVQCPNCGYSTWRAAACAFCGNPFETASDATPQASAPQAAAAPSRTVEASGGFPALFLVWFLLGLLAGIVGFSPRARAAGALLWPAGERFQAPVQQDSTFRSPVPMASRDVEPGSTPRTR